MKPEMKEVIKSFSPSEKPVTRPAKRFAELPGDSLKRKSGRYGGKAVEKGGVRDEFAASIREGARRSGGYHTAEMPSMEVGSLPDNKNQGKPENYEAPKVIIKVITPEQKRIKKILNTQKVEIPMRGRGPLKPPLKPRG